MSARPELKQFGDLLPDDFERHPVWVASHSVDYDEEWYDDTDEETFRPWAGALPVGCDEMYLVSSSFTLADGTTLSGFATPASEEEAWGLIQPQLFLPSGKRLGVWFGMFPPPNAVSDFCAALGKKGDAIFPIHFSAGADLTSEVCSGIIPGLMKSGAKSPEILKE